MNIQILQQNILTVGSDDPDHGPLAIRITVTVTHSRWVRTAVHTAGVVGDIKALDLDITASPEINNVGRSLRTPKLRLRAAAIVPSLTQYPRRIRNCPRRNLAHIAVPRVVLGTAWGVRSPETHHIFAGTDNERVTANHTIGSVRNRKCPKRMFKGAGLIDPGTRIRRVGSAGAFGGCSSVGANIIGRRMGIASHDRDQETEYER